MALALHFDPYAGISAAAALGALLDVGLDADALWAALATLALPPWTLTIERATAGVSGTRATLATTGEQAPLPLGAVRALLAGSALAPAMRERSLRVLTRVAAGEWGTARDDDPAGTPGMILAVVGTLVGLDLLGVAEITTVAPPQGRAGSHVTPAAAALLATVATERPPTLRLRQVGYGLGPHDPTAPHPVAVRVWLGEAEGRDDIEWQSLLAPAAPNATPAAILLVLDHAAETGDQYDRLTALVAAWAGTPARLCAFAGARAGTGPARVTGALEEYAAAGARRIVIQRLGLGPDPAVEDGLAGLIRWARGRWPGLAVVPATPLLTARQLAYRLAGRATDAWEGLANRPDDADTAILLVAPGSAEAEANAEAYRVARLLWEGRDWLTVEVAFLGETTPDLGAAVTRCARLGARAVVILPLLPLAGGGAVRLAAQVAALRAAGAPVPIAEGCPPGTPEGFAAIAWEGFRAASGLPVGDAGHGHGHGADGGHGGLATLRSILPPRYQGAASVNSAPMGAADLVYDEGGQVAWGEVWEGFCDLAIAGGPPHRGDLLEPAMRDAVGAAPDHRLGDRARRRAGLDRTRLPGRGGRDLAPARHPHREYRRPPRRGDPLPPRRADLHGRARDQERRHGGREDAPLLDGAHRGAGGGAERQSAARCRTHRSAVRHSPTLAVRPSRAADRRHRPDDRRARTPLVRLCVRRVRRALRPREPGRHGGRAAPLPLLRGAGASSLHRATFALQGRPARHPAGLAQSRRLRA